MTTTRRALVGLALMLALAPLFSTWTTIVGDRLTLALMAGTAVAALAAGLVGRTLRLPEPAALAVEVVVVGGWLFWLASSFGGPQRVPAVVADGVRRLVTSAVPVPASPGTTVVLCIVAALLALTCDLLTITVDRPALVAAPLLTALLVPVLAPKVHVPPFSGTVLFAAGLALVLFATHRRHRAGVRSGALALSAAAVSTALALVGTLIVAPAIPVPPSTRGTDGEPIQMNDLSLDLKREISRGANTPAFDYATDDGAGAYLRLYSLPTFNATGWHLTNSSVQLGRLAAPPGLVGGTPRRTRVTMTGLKSEWLPAPYAPIATTAGDTWGYLPDSLSILALGVPNRKQATAATATYVVDSLDARPSREALAAAAAESPPDADVTASVPSDVSPELVRLAGRVTAGATTPGQKAQAILDFLAQPEFTYSLDAQPGSGYPGLEDFLLRDHKGFCVQYAASMAILARISGIPSRVAIGFTPGTRVGDHWSVTMHDMHAWPELYFAGYGWVSFEPTPGVSGSPSPTQQPTATPTPTATPSGSTQSPSATPTPTASPVSPGAGTDAWPGLPWVLVGLVLLGGVLATPGLLRSRVRRARLAGGRDPAVMALDALDELRATATDHRRAWPTGSPRLAAEVVASWVVEARAREASPRAEGTGGATAAGIDDPAGATVGQAAAAGWDEATREGVRRLGLAAERARFGGPDHPAEAADWTPTASGFDKALSAAAPTRWAQIRARLFPASLLR